MGIEYQKQLMAYDQSMFGPSAFDMSNFSPYNILAGFIFGTIGWGAWRYGRRLERTKPIMIGLALMVYPYFVFNSYLLWGIGLTLIVILWFHHDR